MHKILIYSHIINLLKSSTCSFLTGAQDSHLQTVMIPEAEYIQLRRRPSEDEQDNDRNMWRILIKILYINKKEFCASSWKLTKVILRCTVSQSSRSANHQVFRLVASVRETGSMSDRKCTVRPTVLNEMGVEKIRHF